MHNFLEFWNVNYEISKIFRIKSENLFKFQQKKHEKRWKDEKTGSFQRKNFLKHQKTGFF